MITICDRLKEAIIERLNQETRVDKISQEQIPYKSDFLGISQPKTNLITYQFTFGETQ